MMTKSEAVAVNVLLRACGIRSEQTVEVSQDAVVLAIHLLAKSAHKALDGSGTSTRDVDAWRAHDGIVPSFDLFDALEELRELDSRVWLGQATELNCNEVDALHAFLGSFDATAAAKFMAAHTDDGAECNRHAGAPA